MVSFTDAESFEEHGRSGAWQRLRSAAGGTRGWSDAYGHALVATGRVELMLDPIMNPWDCGPFPPILREAGGYFGDWSGNETIYARSDEHHEVTSFHRAYQPRSQDSSNARVEDGSLRGPHRGNDG